MKPFWTLLAPLAGVALFAVSGCYPVTAYNCDYYYGYDYYYCEYGYWDPYSTSSSYSTMSYSQVGVDETPNPDPTIAPVIPDSTVNVRSYVYLAHNGEGSDAPDLGGIEDRYPCNQVNDDALTLCSSDDQELADSEYVVVAFELENPLPQADPTNFFVVGFGFDTDNDPTNNFVPPPETANDYFGATDKWYSASYTPTDGWRLDAFVWNGTAIEPVATTARIILERGSGALLVPNSEFAVDVPGNRISLFRHTGDQGANGEWSGLVYPPLGAPLAGP